MIPVVPGMTRLPTINEQPAEKVSVAGDRGPDIVGIWRTIQGEGPYTGEPAVFVRFAGCNLQCPHCDTDYTSHRKFETFDSVIRQITRLSREPGPCNLVVITGGEPFRQPRALSTLVYDLLRGNRFYVPVETNGTVGPPVRDEARGDVPFPVPSPRITVVCSPKTGVIREELRPYVMCLKYVVSADTIDHQDGLPKHVLGGPCPARPWKGFDGTVMVVPADDGDPDKNQQNLEACIWSSQRFGYRLGIQLHKYIGVE